MQSYALEFDFEKSSSIICLVTSKITGTAKSLLGDGIQNEVIKIDFRNNYMGKQHNNLLMIEFRKDELLLYNSNDCYHHGLWLCKSSLYEKDNKIIGSLHGDDMEKNISGFLYANYEFFLDKNTGKIVFDTEEKTRTLSILPAIKTHNEGYCSNK